MEELYARARRGVLDSWRLVALATPGGEVRDNPGVFLAAMGLDSAGSNRAFIMDDTGDPSAVVASAMSFFAERALPFTLEIREELPDGYKGAAVASGLKELFRDPMMTLFPVDESRLRHGAEGCEIREARTSEDLDRTANAAALGFGEDAVRPFATQAIADAGVHYFIGIVDGRVVGTSLVVALDGSAGIYLVSTLPEFRRRGIGEALTAEAVRCGVAAGCDMAYLQASEAGYPVYQRMGFRSVGRTIAFR